MRAPRTVDRLDQHTIADRLTTLAQGVANSQSLTDGVGDVHLFAAEMLALADRVRDLRTVASVRG